MARGLLLAGLCVGFAVLGVIAVRVPRKTVSPALTVVEHPVSAVRNSAAPLPPPRPVEADSVENCSAPSQFAAAGADNQTGLTTLAVSPLGVGESGWAVYAPLVAREIGTTCGPETARFADRLAAWQSGQGVIASGRMDGATLTRMSVIWLLRRPFVRASQKTCPASPDEKNLAQADAAEAYGGKKISARPGALAAYRRMAQAARSALGADAAQLKIASAYRGPIEEALKCALGGCGTAAKARCSAHRTGLAFDFYLGSAPGSNAFSTDPANRLLLSRTPTYRWLVANADRFGFVNYPYEPWHWEWTGEPV